MALNKARAKAKRSPFAGVGEAEVSEGGNWFEEGTHVVRLGEHKIVDGYNGQFAVVECEIIDSTREEYEPGLMRSWVVSLKRQLALRDVKQYVLAVHDGALDEASAEEIDEATESLWSEEQPAEGLVMRVEVKTNKTGTFTKHHWSYQGEEEKKTKRAKR